MSVNCVFTNNTNKTAKLAGKNEAGEDFKKDLSAGVADSQTMKVNNHARLYTDETDATGTLDVSISNGGPDAVKIDWKKPSTPDTLPSGGSTTKSDAKNVEFTIVKV